ncbi:DUF6707 family protein [Hymenobacter latericus]|uniref:DUF6707 family protein n=1 Tax=Hymenobacter sp. YIM 151858-1 TaxID=2987688 RepID=UPI002227A2DB|nr:DUF6707 family protein [Hymenobacter sp. YIM 151858-1]UYZ60650.1 hypothetical protein OIS50_07580 [Hymenobacter sp. YIM 151858-1]
MAAATEQIEAKRKVLAEVASQLSNHPQLARLASSLAKNFKPTVADALRRTQLLAYWLYVSEQPVLALQVCQLLNDIPFENDFNRWTWIELTLALECQLHSEVGNMAQAQNCATAILAPYEAAFPASRRTLAGRLHGSLLREKEISTAELYADATAATNFRLSQLGELLLIRALGGLEAVPVAEVDQQLRSTLNKLRA